MRLRAENEGVAVDGRGRHAAVVECVDGEFFELAAGFDDRRFAVLVAEVDAAVCVDGRCGERAADAFLPDGSPLAASMQLTMPSSLTMKIRPSTNTGEAVFATRDLSRHSTASDSVRLPLVPRRIAHSSGA